MSSIVDYKDFDLDNLKNRVSLGIFTKSPSTPQNTRLKRYALQNQSAKLLPKERVCNCLKKRISKHENVGVMYNKKREKAHYSNIQRCGSVWTCPVCASNISEKRKVEVKKAIDAHRATGGFVYMLTLTVPHSITTSLRSLLEGFKKATQRFFGGTRASLAMFKKYGKIGHIKALEVTYGKNGWHPHYHIILFLDKPLLDHSDLITNWQNACKIAGLKIPSAENGVNVKDGTYADGYVSKWGLEDEITKSHIKTGKEGGMTPWDLLKMSMSDDKYSKLFQEFAICFKGKRQLSWSRGLKSLYGIDDKTDEQLAEETEKESKQVTDIDNFLWYLIKSHSKRADFLSLVEHDQKHNTQHAIEFLIKLSEKAITDFQNSA